MSYTWGGLWVAWGTAHLLGGHIWACLPAPPQESPRLLMHLPLCELFHDSAWDPSHISLLGPVPLSPWPRLPGTTGPAPPFAPVSLLDTWAPGARPASALDTRFHLDLCSDSKKELSWHFPSQESVHGLPLCQLLFQHTQCGQGGDIPGQRTLWLGPLTWDEGLVDRSSVPRQLKCLLGSKRCN